MQEWEGIVGKEKPGGFSDERFHAHGELSSYTPKGVRENQGDGTRAGTVKRLADVLQ